MKRPSLRRRTTDPSEAPTEIAAAEPAAGPADRNESAPARRSKGKVALVAVGGLALLAAAGAGGYLLGEEEAEPVAEGPAPAPTVIVEQAPEPDVAEQLGFPGFATRNTTRVGGVDPVADAAGIALASYPALGGVPGPPAVVLASTDSWQAALAAASLSAAPVRAPILLGGADEVPEFTAAALDALSPQGIKEADDVELIAIGDVARPDGLKSVEIDGDGPAEVAKAIDSQRAKLSGIERPEHLIVVPEQAPEFAMPAAAWAARSGDSILFASKERVPEATIDVIERHAKSPIYVLGPPSAIGSKALAGLEKADGGPVTRVGASDPVENAIEFARFADGSFGWEIADPGHGFAIANTDRPLDAAAAAPLAAGGKPGPLLVTDDAAEVPVALRSFLLDTKPGYLDEPERAVYNHIWLLGDTEAISLDFQAQVDELTSLIQVREGTGGPEFGGGTSESEVDPGGGTGGTGAGDEPHRP